MNNKTHVASSIKVLEGNLESKAFTSKLEHSTEVNTYAPKPIETVVTYADAPFYDPPPIYQVIYEVLHKYKICDHLFGKIHDVIDDFGTWLVRIDF